MEKVTIEQARRGFDELVETVRKEKKAITVTGSNGDLVRLVPIPEPAYYFKGRPVFTEEQLAHMDGNYPDESEWVAEILKRGQKEATDGQSAAS